MTNTLNDLGWNDFFEASFGQLQKGQIDAIKPARIIADYGMQCDVISENGQHRAEISGRLRFNLDAPELAPAVGDWVAIRASDDGLALVTDVLARQSQLIRQAAGKRVAPQVVGANLDVVFIVTSLNQDFNARRVERYITAIIDGNATPVIVLTKADLVNDWQTYKQEAQKLRQDIAVVVTAANNQDTVNELYAYLGYGRTAAFVGSSGVGKSTLVNALTGLSLQATADIRETDDKGRHTTTHRQLIILPERRGLIIDTPGMREFHLWDSYDSDISAGSSLDDSFEDISALAEQCRFRDCLHEHEIDCAVQEAVTNGTLSQDRVRSFHKLHRELDEQRARQDIHRARTKKKAQKKISKGLRRHYKKKP